MNEEKKSPPQYWKWLLLAFAVVGVGVVSSIDLTNTDSWIDLTDYGNGTWNINWNTTKPVVCSVNESSSWNGTTFVCISSGVGPQGPQGIPGVNGTNGAGNITGGGTTNYIPIWSNSTNLINSAAYFDGTPHLFVPRDIILARADGDRRITFNQTSGAGLYFVNSGQRFRFDGGGVLAEFHNINDRIYWTGSGNPTMDLYSDSADRTFRIVNEGSRDAHLSVDNNVSAQAVCISGDCRTSWSSGVQSKFVTISAETITDTNQPLAERAFRSTYFFTITNLSGYNHFKYGTSRGPADAAATAVIFPKYRTGACNTLVPSNWDRLDDSLYNLSQTTANIATVSPLLEITSGAKTEVCIGMFTQGGDGVVDPQYRNVWVEFS